MADGKTIPRTFYLNESHEFTRDEREGRGSIPKYAPINWSRRGARLRASIEALKTEVASSRDPLRDRRLFMLASAKKKVAKTSTARNKPPQFFEKTRYAGEHSRVFRRLGVDLLHVTPDGDAIVHASPDRVDQLALTAAQLSHASNAEKARWATINAFGMIPDEQRLDPAWVLELPSRKPVEAVVELQPLLTTAEGDEVMRAILSLLDQGADEALVAAGTDFSGRQWYRGRAGKASLVAIAKHFFSVDAIHAPIPTVVSVQSRRQKQSAAVPLPPTTLPHQAELPVVAVVDCGIPAGHRTLSAYSRGQYVDSNSMGVAGNHGSFVASRVVFGELDFSNGMFAPPAGSCRFLDVVVTENADELNTKRIVPAMDAVIGAYPDVRVFNLSAGGKNPFPRLGAIEQREVLLGLRDLDNFIFARDVITVVAAGNTPEGVQPSVPYPDHFEDPAWALGNWAMGFNTLTCGATVGRASSGGLAANVDWPSPFTRVGPGVAGARIPEFTAHGGDCSPTYGWRAPLGEWVCSADGTWEDQPGTSFAAPLLAREAAFAFQYLDRVCVPGARPFGVAVKAFLALTARLPQLPPRVQPLAERTIGRGYASARRLPRPDGSTAVVLWQGVLGNKKDVARVQVPIPREWLRAAQQPKVRLVLAWDPPVHSAAVDIWACRKVRALLRPEAPGNAVPGSRSDHSTYPLSDRTYDLSRERLEERGITPSGDTWVVEVSYDEIAEYAPGIEFSPQQRVAFALELFDASEARVSPQAIIQGLPIASTMVALGVPRTRISTPVVIRVRG